MIKFADPVYNFIERVLPVKWVTALNNYSSGTQSIQAESEWKKVLKSYINIGITNGIVILALMLLSINFLLPFLNENIANTATRSVIALVVSLGAAAPFLWALMAKRPNNMAYKELWLDKIYSRGPLLVVEILRIVIGVLLIGFWVNNMVSTPIAILMAVAFTVIVLILFSKGIQRLYQRLEGRFITNLNARETAAEKEISKKENLLQKQFNPQSTLSPWDAHIVDMEIGQHAEYIGKTLAELAWREQYGVNIAYIKRGELLIYAPGRNTKLLPFDHVGIIATDEQMQVFKPVFDTAEKIDPKEYNIEDIIVQKIVVDEHNKLKGQTIRGSGIRERTNGLVVGIERNKERMLNPDSTTLLEWGDIVWIVGERKKIQQLNKG
jgi:CPA2 family monovalent cation:H+ antiporter-2